MSDKTNTAFIPEQLKDSPYLWRGILDGDGCFGLRKQKKNFFPFVGFTTKSEELKNAFVYIVKQVVNQDLNTSRNARDNVYNIMITSIKAKSFC